MNEEEARFLRAVRLLAPEQQWKLLDYLERLVDDQGLGERMEVTEQERKEIIRILTGQGWPQ